MVQGELCGTETAAANTMIDLDPSSVEIKARSMYKTMFSYPTILAPERTWLLRKYVATLEKKTLLKRLRVRN